MVRITLILCALMVFSGCSDRFSIMKRKYQKGYYIAYRQKPAKTSEARTAGTAKATVATETVKTEVVASSARNRHETENAATEKSSATPYTGNASSHQKPAVVTDNAIASVAVPKSEPKSVSIRNLDELLTKSKQNSGDVDLIILVLLAIIIPPLGVYLKGKTTNQWFWITLILWLLAISFFFFPLGGLLWPAAAVIAVLYVLDMI